MASSVGNLFKSKATIWIAAAGEALPDETTVAAGEDWGGNWTAFGWTKAPLAFRYAYETVEMKVEQFLSAINRTRTSESLELETVLAELTASNLAYALGSDPSTDVTTTAAGASQVGFDELDIGGTVCTNKWAIGFEGVACDDTGTQFPLRVSIPRCTIQLNGDLSFSQADDDYTGIPLIVHALGDTANTGRLAIWQRVTAAATS